MRRTTRGQATVELALGSLIFITVVFFGIHFAEIGIVKLRVQQAAISALWDTTGMRAHAFTDQAGDAEARFFDSNQIRDGDGRSPQVRATQKYRSFDALQTGPNPNRIQLVATTGSNLAVRCQPERISPMPNGAEFAPLRAGYEHPSSGGRRVDGMGCNASAVVSVGDRVPQRMMQEDQGGFFRVAHVSRPQFPVCAFGRARGDDCRGHVALALDDWGLAGSAAAFGREWEDCDQNCMLKESGSGNQAFKNTVDRIFLKYNDDGAPAFSVNDFMTTLFTRNPNVPQLGEVPVDERKSRLIFIGEGGRIADGTLSKPFHFWTREQDSIRPYWYQWPSSPYSEHYRAAYTNRRQCFLGSLCSEPLFEKQSWR